MRARLRLSVLAALVLLGSCGGGGGGGSGPGGVPVGPGASALATGDFDGDGLLDLVTANALLPNLGSVTLLRGAPDGSFASLGDFPCGGLAGGRSIAVLDFDEDNALDVVTTTMGGSALALLRGGGNGTVSFFASLPLVTEGTQVVAADLNGDTHADLAVLEGDYFVRAYLGAGDGTFSYASAVAVAQGSQALALAQLNYDSHADFAVIGSATRSLSVLLGAGDGSFSGVLYPNRLPAGTKQLAVGYFAGTGVHDLAVSCLPDHSIRILIGVGDGTFTDAPSLVMADPGVLLAGDFVPEAGGVPFRTDLVVADRFTSGIAYFQGTGDGTTFTLGGVREATAEHRAMVSGEFNPLANGRPDLAVLSNVTNADAGGRVFVLLGPQP